MRTPMQALLWELWRTTWLGLLMRFFWLLAVAWGGYLATVMLPAGEQEAQIVRGFFFLCLVFVSIFSQLSIVEIDNRQLGFSFRLGFARPVSTASLVLIPMGFAMVAAVTCFIAPALLFRALTGVPYPMLGPAIIIACFVACLLAATWSPSTTLGKTLAWTMLAIGALTPPLVLELVRGNSDPILLVMTRPPYLALAWQQYLALSCVAVAAFVFTVIAVDRQRHGDRFKIEGNWIGFRAATVNSLPAWLGSPARAATSPFTNRFAAQCWYDLRRSGSRVLLLGLVAPLLLLMLVTIVSRFDPQWRGAPYLWLCALVACPFVYQLVGADGALALRRTHGAVQYSVFDATRAMRNDQVIASKLIVIACCSLIGWLCMASAAGVHVVLAGDWHAWSRIGTAVSNSLGEVPFALRIAALCTAALLYVSSSSVLLAFGLWVPRHGKLFMTMAAVAYFHFILAIVEAKQDWSLGYLWMTYGYAISLAIVIGCSLALWKSISSGFLGKRLFLAACGLWIAYVCSAAVLYAQLAPPNSVPPAGLVFAASLLLLPLGTTAFAPLALASHRHG